LTERILIVDDDPASILLLTTVLAELGVEVRSEARSCHALNAFYDFEPDLILLDLHMPSGSLQKMRIIPRSTT